MFPPGRIVCLTEETVETLYLLGEQDRIVGISGYVSHAAAASASSAGSVNLVEPAGLRGRIGANLRNYVANAPTAAPSCSVGRALPKALGYARHFEPVVL